MSIHLILLTAPEKVILCLIYHCPCALGGRRGGRMPSEPGKGSGTKAWRYSNSRGWGGVGKEASGRPGSKHPRGTASGPYPQPLVETSRQDMRWTAPASCGPSQYQSPDVPSCQRAWYHLPCLPMTLSNKCLNQVPGSRGPPRVPQGLTSHACCPNQGEPEP